MRKIRKIIALAVCMIMSVPCSAEVITYGGYHIDVPEVFVRQEDESILQDGLHYHQFWTEDGDALIITFYDIPDRLRPIYGERKGFFHTTFDVDEQYTLQTSEDLDLPSGIPASVRVYLTDSSQIADVCFNDGITAFDLVYVTFSTEGTPDTFSDFMDMAEGVEPITDDDVVNILSQFLD